MKRPSLPGQTRPIRLALFLAAFAPLLAAASEAPGEVLPSDSKVVRPWAGGVDPRPTLRSLKRAEQADQLLLEWIGLAGPYRVQKSDAVAGGPWTNVGDPTTDESAVIPVSDAMGILRVEGPRPTFLSQSTCRGCHPTAHNGVQDTAHARAFETLKRIGQAANAHCLPCHTVGFGIPGGFVSEAATPLLAGVQCENCHGPGGNHVADPADLKARPVVSQASTLCGGCHSDFHHPTFDEWLTSGHNGVTPSVARDFLNSNITSAEARMRSCGSCHSGSVRLAMLNGAEANPPVALPAMPSGDHAANTSITCAVCHTAHESTPFGSQLRNPPYSTNFFSYYTSTNTNFTLQYQVDVNVCGQCHNQRGAVWDSSSRPPHHSPQYNVLIGNIGDAGIVGIDLSASPQSTHREITKQCTHCHTHGHGSENPSEEDPVYTGHSFKPLPENCVPCHTPEEAEVLIGFRQRNTRIEIALVKELLDKWGETSSPEPLRTKYGKLAWEYTSAGQLSQPAGGPSVSGPAANEQSLVPAEIKKARFVLYMIEHDGSYGVHNARFSTTALREAKTLVEAQITP
ncbi:MAG: multiheme c-type cytochrome [Limisphaerales bacterium]